MEIIWALMTYGRDERGLATEPKAVEFFKDRQVASDLQYRLVRLPCDFEHGGNVFGEAEYWIEPRKLR